MGISHETKRVAFGLRFVACLPPLGGGHFGHLRHLLGVAVLFSQMERAQSVHRIGCERDALAADGCHDGVVGAVLDGGGRS